MQDKIRTVLYPVDLPGNRIFKIQKRFLEDSGFEVCALQKAIKKLWKVKIINFNFYDTIHSKNTLECYAKYIGKLALLILLKFCHVKIIYTMHNKMGHDTKNPWMDNSLIRFMYDKSDSIVAFCEESKNVLKNVLGNKKYKKNQNKITVIPLISYIGEYQSSDRDFRHELGIKSDDMVMLFVGAIRPYKNIELIVEIAHRMMDKRVKFVIAGYGNSEYVSQLKSVVNGDNVIFIPKFIKDEEMADLARASDILILPYNKASSLNSGSCLFAFSYHRNVISPMIGTVKEFDDNLIYSYDYMIDADHVDKLYEATLKAYDDFMLHKDEFIHRQEELYRIASTKHSVETISGQYKELYLELLK
jgi:beta-1,4-mannosyltransferase